MIETPRPPRSPWQLLYGTAHHLRRRWYRRRAARLPRPVVSIGNLHWGGAGKTPLTAAVAAHLRDRGRRVAILSRGYRSKGSGVRLISDGEGPLLGPSLAGDEPVLLAGLLPGVAVLASVDRFSAGVHAMERLEPRPDLFLLDDGFSHLKLHRDLDLLAFPADDPFAGARLLPGGRLREPLASSARADAAVLTGGERSAADELARALAPFGFDGPVFASPTVVGTPVTEHGEPLPRGSRVLLVVGIARPRRVAESLRAQPYPIVDTLVFADHHAYPASSLRKIERACRRTGAEYVLTTEKDQVKLLGRLETPLAALPARAAPEPALGLWLEARLAELEG